MDARHMIYSYSSTTLQRSISIVNMEYVVLWEYKQQIDEQMATCDCCFPPSSLFSNPKVAKSSNSLSRKIVKRELQLLLLVQAESCGVSLC